VKVLLDTCVWGGARDALRAAGHDVVWAGEWPVDPGDQEILDVAMREGRVLITLDKDFGELVVVRGACHSGIVRLVNLAARTQGEYAVLALDRYQNELAQGAIVTVSSSRVRVRAGSPRK